MKSEIFYCSIMLLLMQPCWAETATSDWLSAPKPKFPTAALKKGSEGRVTLHIVLAEDGSVLRAKVSRSSGDTTLDEVARAAVFKWRMKPKSIKAEYLKEGKEQIIEFRQEAAVASLFRNRSIAQFANLEEARDWMYAPFPAYPDEARERRETGRVILKVQIGGDGRVAAVEILRSSGYPDLDNAALAAVRLWRAHKTAAGKVVGVPVNFTLNRQ